MAKIRVVIDTNVLISAIFWTGKPKQLLNKARKGEVIFLTSTALIEELKEVLTAKDKPFKLNEKEVQRIIEHIAEIAEIIVPKNTISICKDEKDNRVLECAIDGRADYIVTGDRDLLELGFFKEIKIIKVAELLELIDR